MRESFVLVRMIYRTRRFNDGQNFQIPTYFIAKINVLVIKVNKKVLTIMEFIDEWYKTNIKCLKFMWKLKYIHLEKDALSHLNRLPARKMGHLIFHLVNIFQPSQS